MKVAIFSTYEFEKQTLKAANADRHEIKFISASLNSDTAILASGYDAVVIFVNDDASASVLETLSNSGVKYIALRSAGFNNVDCDKARQLGFRMARVPAYSPYAVAEHAVTLMLALNRKIIKANNRVHEANFSLDGLTGFDMNGKTVGIMGTGQIGSVIARILYGFGCELLAFDEKENQEIKEKFGVRYVSRDELYQLSDIITLHLPLLPATHYLINAASISKMKPGVMIINTSRGGLVNTKDVVEGLKTGAIGYLGLDVYEEEAGLFFEDHSEEILQDDVISRLLSFKNVLITSHQGFLTDTALKNIAETTFENLNAFQNNEPCKNEIK